MKCLIIITLFIFVGILELFSQSDFRAAYIVKQNSDKLYGFVEYKGNKANAKKCIFRADLNSENQFFTPDDIDSYRFIDGKFYVSRLVKSGEEVKLMFLEYLINGIVDLYYYRDGVGEHYLIHKENEKLYELKNEEKEIVRNNTTYNINTKEYVGVLKATFGDSPSVSKKVDHTILTHKSLIKIANDYHNEVCSGEECIIYKKKIKKSKSIFGLLVGVNVFLITETPFIPKELYYYNNNENDVSLNPSVGFFIKTSLPFINEKLYFLYEGTYSHRNFKTHNSYSEPSNHMVYLNDIYLTQNLLANCFSIKHEFSKGKIRPTFQLGGFIDYLYSTDYKRDLEAQFTWGTTYSSNQTLENPYNDFDYGINLGLGVKSIVLKNREIFVDLNYQRGFGLLQGLNTNKFILNIGFQIGGAKLRGT